MVKLQAGALRTNEMPVPGSITTTADEVHRYRS